MDAPSPSASGRPHRTTLVLLSAGCAITVGLTVGLLATASIPLGVPGEWEWPRTSVAEWQQAFDPSAVVTVFVAIGAHTGATWLACQLRRRWLAIMILMASTLGWLVAVQLLPVSGIALIRPLWVPYDSSASGYFQQAREQTSADRFLVDYEQNVREGDVLHMGTHPPGLTLWHIQLLKQCERHPEFSRWLVDSIPRSVRASFRQLERRARQGPRLVDSELAALWLSSLLMWTAAAASIIPVSILAVGPGREASGWVAVSMWGLMPALAIFLPKSDAGYPLLSASILAVTHVALRRRAAAWFVVTGCLLWIGLVLSLAFVAIAAAVGLAIVIGCLSRKDLSRRRQIARAALLLSIVGVTGLGLTIAFQSRTDCNLIQVWWINYQKHSAFYDQFPRAWWKWLLVNPVEAAFAVGLPLAGLALISCFRRRHLWEPVELGVLGVWLLLWISGKNMGEAARLWLFLTPVLCLSAAVSLQRLFPDRTRCGSLERTSTAVLVILQAGLAAATVAVIDGFHFAGG